MRLVMFFILESMKIWVTEYFINYCESMSVIQCYKALRKYLEMVCFHLQISRIALVYIYFYALPNGSRLMWYYKESDNVTVTWKQTNN